nr:hypothetical protein [Tanacetum cinerariifolium]
MSVVQTRSKVNKNSEAHALKMKAGLMLCKRNCCSSKFKRIEAIRIFLAFASYMGFIVYQMDVKSAFLYGIINEEVNVSQPPSFVDPKFPNKVYKVVNALYGLHQALRAWYATLSTFLEKSGYRRGAIDKTFLIKQDKKDIMLKSWCNEFEELMKNRFQMSYMGELTFFLGLQVKQKEDGIFISQDEYVAEILKKINFLGVKTSSTPIETQKPLVKDEEVVDVDVHLYRSMICSLMYLTASRPDIMFAVCACSRFQVTPKSSHLQAVRRIFRYLKGQPKLGLWYPKVSSFDLETYSKSDYTVIMLTIMATSTTEAEYVAAAHCCLLNPVFHSKTKHIEIRHHFIRDAYEKKLIQVLKIQTDDNVADLLTKAFDVSRFQFLVMGCDCYGDYLEFILFIGMKIKGYKWYLIVNNISQIHAKVASKPLVITEASIRGDLLFNDVDRIDCLTNEAIFENLTLMGYEGDLTKLTFQKYLFSPQWKFLIHTIIHCLSFKTVAEGEDLGTPTESQPTPSSTQPSAGDQPLLTESFSDRDSSQDPRVDLDGTEALSALCTNLSNRVLALETVKDAQAKEILTLKARIKKLKKRCKPSILHHRAWLRSVSLLSKKKRLKVAQNEGRQSTVDTARPDDDTARPDVSTARQEFSTVGPTTTPTTSTIFNDKEMTLADTLIKLKDDKAKGVAFKDSKSTDRHTRSILTLKPLPTIDPKDKGKGVLEEPELAKKMTKSDFDAAQIARDEEIAR